MSGKRPPQKARNYTIFRLFHVIFPFQKVFFPSIWVQFAVKNPTPTVAFTKNFFHFGRKKKPGCCHAPRSYAVFMSPYLASAGLNVALTVFIGCVPAALGRRFLSFPSPRNRGGYPCSLRISSHRSTEICSDCIRN